MPRPSLLRPLLGAVEEEPSTVLADHDGPHRHGGAERPSSDRF
jgi:hypothetical protein